MSDADTPLPLTVDEERVLREWVQRGHKLWTHGGDFILAGHIDRLLATLDATRAVPDDGEKAAREFIESITVIEPTDPERLAKALHQAYCKERRPMHSDPLHSAEAIAAIYVRLTAPGKSA